MKFLFKQVILFIFVVQASIIFAQNPQEILEKVSESYKLHQNYSVNITYEYYNLRAKTKKFLEQKKAYYVVDRQKKYFKIGKELELFDNGDTTIKINHSQKAILVTNSLSNGLSNYEFDYKELKDYMDVVVKQQNESIIVLEFKAKPITSLPFSTLIVYIDRKNYFIRQQEFFYFSTPKYSIKTKKQELITPKLVVKYSNYNFNKKNISTAKFDTSTYFSQSTHKAVGVGKYKTYSIINLLKK